MKHPHMHHHHGMLPPPPLSAAAQLLPPLVPRLLRESTVGDAPILPLRNVTHTFPLSAAAAAAAPAHVHVQAALSPGAASAAALRKQRQAFDDAGEGEGGSDDAAPEGPPPEPAVFPCFPIAIADMLCGGAVFIGAGYGRGVEAHVSDVRQRVSSVQAAGSGSSPDLPLLPPVPFAPRTVAAASATGGRSKGIVSSVVAGASSMAGVAIGASGTDAAVPPPWAGTATADSGATIVGSLSVPGPNGYTAVTALAIDGDVLAVGYTDGSVRIWHVTGLEGLPTLSSWPALHPRPHTVLTGTAAGAVLSLSVSRDDDVLVAGFAGEVRGALEGVFHDRTISPAQPVWWCESCGV
jgi:hypothetical protein